MDSGERFEMRHCALDVSEARYGQFHGSRLVMSCMTGSMNYMLYILEVLVLFYVP